MRCLHSSRLAALLLAGWIGALCTWAPAAVAAPTSTQAKASAPAASQPRTKNSPPDNAPKASRKSTSSKNTAKTAGKSAKGAASKKTRKSSRGKAAGAAAAAAAGAGTAANAATTEPSSATETGVRLPLMLRVNPSLPDNAAALRSRLEGLVQSHAADASVDSVTQLGPDIYAFSLRCADAEQCQRLRMAIESERDWVAGLQLDERRHVPRAPDRHSPAAR